MELIKRYSISFAIAGSLLYFFTVWVEKKYEGSMPHNLSTKKEEFNSINLKPKRFLEKCVDLKPQQFIEYGFKSNGALSFNLHSHEEGQTIYHDKEDSVSEFQKKFQAEKRAYYCLTWGNAGKEDVKMDYNFKIAAQYIIRM